MADRSSTFNERFILTAQDKASPTFRKVGKEAETSERHLSKLGGTFQKVAVSGLGRTFGDLKNSLGFFARGNISAGVSSLGRSFEGLSNTGYGVIKVMALMTAGIAGAVAISQRAISVYSRVGKELSKMSNLSGMSAGQSLNVYAQFKMTGAELEGSRKSLGMFAKNVESARQGTGKQALAMKKLGIELKNTNGEWKTVDELLPEFRNKLSRTGDAATKAFAAQTMLGRGWQGLARWISASAAEMARANKIVSESGFKFDKGGFKEFLATQREVALRWELMWAALGQALAEPITAVTRFAVKTLPPLMKKLWDLRAVLIAVGSALVGLYAFVKIAESVSRFKDALRSVGWSRETAAIQANTAALAQNAAARNLSGLPIGKKGKTSTLMLSKSVKSRSLLAQEAEQLGSVPILQRINKAETATSKFGAAASKASLGLRSLGAGLVNATAAIGPYVIAAAAAAAAVGGINWAYNEWQEAEAQAATAHAEFADNAAKQLERVASKVGVTAKAYKDFAQVLNVDVFSDMNEHITQGSKSFLGGPVWYHGTGDAKRQAAERAKEILKAANDVFAKGLLTEARKKQIADMVHELESLGTIAAPAARLLAQELLNIDSHALDTAGDKAARLAQTLKDASTMVTVMANGVTSTMTVDMAKRMKLLDEQGQAINGAQIVENIQKTEAETAAASAELAKTLADIPKNITQVLKRDWGAIGRATDQAMHDFSGGFAGLTDEMVALWTDRTKNLAEITGALGGVLETLAKAPKKVIAPTQQNWTALGQAVRSAMSQVLTVYADISDDLLKTNNERVGAIGSMAGSLGGFIKALADMPKKAVSPAKQAWGRLASTMRSALGEVLAVFDDTKNKELAKQAQRSESIGSMAGGLGSFISSIADLPKKAVRVAPQAYSALASQMRSALGEVLAVFDASKNKELARIAERSGSVGSMAGALGSFIGAIADLPKTGVKWLPQAWTSLARQMRSALGEVLAVFDASKNKELARIAERSGSVGSMAGNLGSFIGALADLPDKAITVIPQKWGALAKVLKRAIGDVLDVFKGDSTKTLGTDATRLGSVSSSAGSIASIITSYADLTAEAIDKAITGLKETAKRSPEIGRELVNVVKGIGQGIGDFAVADEMVAVTQAVTGIAENVASTLKTFGEMTKAGIDQAILSLAYATDNAKPLAGAMATMATALRDAFTDAGVNEEFAKSTDAIGRVMDTVSGVFDFVASMTQEAMHNIGNFVTYAGGMDDLWTSVGHTLSEMIRTLIDAIDIIPDGGKLETARTAVETLRGIFDSMTELGGTISSAAAWMTGGATGTGARDSNVEFAAAPAAASATTNIYVDISWSTLTGEPSAREKRQLVEWLLPEINRVRANQTRVQF